MGFGSFLRYTLVFLSGLYFGYKYHEAVNIYDQELQKIRRPYFQVYNDDDNNDDDNNDDDNNDDDNNDDDNNDDDNNDDDHNDDNHNNDNQSDSSSSSSDDHSEPEFIGRNLTPPRRENSTESDDLESSESSEEHSHSDTSLNSATSSTNGYMRSFMSAINQIRPGQSTPQLSRAGSPHVVSDGPGSPQSPIVVHDSDDTNVPRSSSIMGTIRTVGSNIPLGIIMVSRPHHSPSPSPSPIHSPDPSPGPSRPFSPDTGHNSNDNANNNKSDNESDGDTDPCERFSCFA